MFSLIIRKQLLLKIKSNKSVLAEAEQKQRLTCFDVIALTSGWAGLNPLRLHMVHLTLKCSETRRASLCHTLHAL